jgi:hypothetical protein
MSKRIGRPPLPIKPGQRFGRLTVIKPGPPSKSRDRRWWCECSCSFSCILVSASDLHSGNTTSCGCTKRFHGLYKTPEYRCWVNIRQRCYNANDPCYPYYGGRGIRVCTRWLSLQPFLDDIGQRPSARHSIERRDVNGDYGPDNCFWAIPKQQMRNRRNTVWVAWQGEVMRLAEAAEFAGIDYDRAWSRMRRGKEFIRVERPPDS